MKCRCFKDYRDGKIHFKANEIYEYNTVPTSSRFPPVYVIYNGNFGRKVLTYAEFKSLFRRVA
jgi:hypothetical protein